MRVIPMNKKGLTGWLMWAVVFLIIALIAGIRCQPERLEITIREHLAEFTHIKFISRLA